MLFADSDSEGEYLRFGNDDRPSNDRASPGTSLLHNGAAEHGESVQKQVIILALCPTGMGVVGVDVVLVSIGELLLSDDRPDCVICSDRAQTQSAAGRQYRCSQCWVTLGLCAVPCNERYHTLKSYKWSPRYLIGQIAGQLIKK